MALLSLEEIRRELFANPSIYPHDVDFAREAVLFVRLDRDAYKAASFLDQRILTPQSEGRWVRFGEMGGWFEDIPASRPLHFIFHAGHVGSTLISRLIEEAGGVLSLREPLPLRALAEAHDQMRNVDALAGPETVETLMHDMLALWGRGYPDTAAIVLKATSSTARLCPVLMAALPAARALYVNLAAEPYLATLLAGENSYMDLRGHGPERIQRLARLAAPSPTPLYAMSIGEIAALTWLVEKLTQARAERTCEGRLLALDFDAFLQAPGDALRHACAHLGVDAPESFFASITENRVLTRYSKAPEHPYTPQFRGEVLAASRASNAAEIRRGLHWLEDFARKSPGVTELLST